MRDLLAMRDGLAFVEEYVIGQTSDVIEMLWGDGKDDMAALHGRDAPRPRTGHVLQLLERHDERPESHRRGPRRLRRGRTAPSSTVDCSTPIGMTSAVADFRHPRRLRRVEFRTRTRPRLREVRSALPARWRVGWSTTHVARVGRDGTGAAQRRRVERSPLLLAVVGRPATTTAPTGRTATRAR